MRPGRASGVALAALSVVVPGASAALTVRTLSGSAIGMPSTFTRDADAPNSTFVKASVDGALESVFVASEVEPARIETTRTLLSEFNARRTEGAIVVDLPADILFDFDKATLRPDAEMVLAQAADILRSYPAAAVTIGGHTDAKGDDAYNNSLSLRRAQAVAERLQGATGRSLAAEGFGERQPVAPNAHPDGGDDPAGRQKNRRVELRITPHSQGN